MLSTFIVSTMLVRALIKIATKSLLLPVFSTLKNQLHQFFLLHTNSSPNFTTTIVELHIYEVRLEVTYQSILNSCSL